MNEFIVKEPISCSVCMENAIVIKDITGDRRTLNGTKIVFKCENCQRVSAEFTLLTILTGRIRII